MESLLQKTKVYWKVYQHCEDHGEYRELEQLISTHSGISYLYARDIIISKRFEIGEEVIATSETINRNYQKFLETL